MLTSDGGLLVREDDHSTVFRKPVIYQTVGGRRRHVSGNYALRVDGTVGFQLGSYDPSKTLVIDPVLAFSTFFDSKGSGSGSRTAIDPDGNVYMMSIGNADTPGLTHEDSDQDFLYVAKLDSTASRLLYITYVHSVAYDDYYGSSVQPSALTVDWRGVVTIAGTTMEPTFPVVRPLFEAKYCNTGSENAGFITTLNPSGAIDFSTFLCGATYNGDLGEGTQISGLAADDDGVVAVTGSTKATDFPVTPDAFQCAVGSAFLTKIDVEHARIVYSSYFGKMAEAEALAFDRRGALFVGGWTYVTDPARSPIPLKGPQFSGLCHSPNGEYHVKNVGFLAKFDRDMKLSFSTMFSGPQCDENNQLRSTMITAIAVDAYGDPYVVGDTNKSDLPVVHPYRVAGGNPASLRSSFIAKFNQTGTELVYSTHLNPGRSSAVSVDPQGLATVAGDFDSSEALELPFREKDPVRSSCDYDCGAVMRLNTSGTDLVFSTRLGSYYVASTSSNLLGDAVVSGFGSGIPLENSAWPPPEGDAEGLFLTRFESDPVTAAKALRAYILSGKEGVLSDDLALVETQLETRNWSGAKVSLDRFDTDVSRLVQNHVLVTHIGDKLLAATRQFRTKIDTYPR